VSYAELQVTSHFSFLRGASSPDELVTTAFGLGLAGIAIADRNTLAGVVRAYHGLMEVEKAIAAINEKLKPEDRKVPSFRLLIGARLDFTDMPSLLCFPEDRAAYGRLSQMLTDGKMRSEKGSCTLAVDDLFAYGDGQRLIALPPEQPDNAFADHLKILKDRFGERLYLAAHHLYRGDDAKRLARLDDLAGAIGVPLVATNDVHAHIAARRPLQDVLTCIREGCTVAEAGFRLHANAERHLKSPQEMARLFRRRPDAVTRTMEIVEACQFSLKELKYEYPAEPVPEGQTPQGELVRQVRLNLPIRYPNGVPAKVQDLLKKELALIRKLKYARYFLTVYDIVKYARKQEILCQGRGSAANSAVCFVLGITAVNPATNDLLIDRFLSETRGDQPPDIDVDFEHERREEVMQYIFDKYGRDRAGIVATLVTYRPKSAIRDVGKVMGLSEDVIGILSKTLWGWGREGIQENYIREAGLDPNERNLRTALKLARELIGFPRHLSQHTGGFVITKGKLSEVVPIENAAMEDRTVIEWDKDDLDRLGMLKIDVLALGMLTCLRKSYDLLKSHYGVDRHLYDNDEDPRVYDMLCRADSVGVFQVESRAQMTMLPRLQPRKLYDLVIEVAIVRPGPIQGDMVHPFLTNRKKEPEDIEYPSLELKEVLKRTCGVPLFQEQAMQIAMVAAKFSPNEANELRRAMATFRHPGTIGKLKERFIEGMVANKYERNFAERCFSQIEGFGEYGFPESHAASFALLVYASSWVKCHYPDVFACAILNSQPMGFYRPAQLVRDAKEHGVAVRPVDVMHSEWDCTLEPVQASPPPNPPPSRGRASDHIPPPRWGRLGGGECRQNTALSKQPRFALRLGFRQLKGFREQDAAALVEARAKGDFATMRSVWLGAGLSGRALETLAKGDGWGGIGLNRRAALWAAKGLGSKPLPLFAAADKAEAIEPTVTLPSMSMGQEVTEDYRHLSLSLKTHPMALLRETIAAQGIVPSGSLKELRDGARAQVAGIVLIRQQPGTASGVIFVTLEDETGVANIVVWPRIFQQFRRELLGSQLMGVTGLVQRDESGYVIHLVADRLVDLSSHLHGLGDPVRPFADMLSRSDEAKGGPPDRHAGVRARVIPASRDFR
jgi:error-prone DNA polymerase